VLDLWTCCSCSVAVPEVPLLPSVCEVNVAPLPTRCVSCVLAFTFLRPSGCGFFFFFLNLRSNLFKRQRNAKGKSQYNWQRTKSTEPGRRKETQAEPRKRKKGKTREPTNNRHRITSRRADLEQPSHGKRDQEEAKTRKQREKRPIRRERVG